MVAALDEQHRQHAVADGEDRQVDGDREWRMPGRRVAGEELLLTRPVGGDVVHASTFPSCGVCGVVNRARRCSARSVTRTASAGGAPEESTACCEPVDQHPAASGRAVT
jgi:hypothetical protein